jgi:hypothetical protein
MASIEGKPKALALMYPGGNSEQYLADLRSQADLDASFPTAILLEHANMSMADHLCRSRC